MNQPPANPTAQRCYTAAQIARAIGVSRQAVQRLVSGIAASAQIIVNGNVTNAWTFFALPAETQKALEAMALNLGFRNAEQLLESPAKRWEPARPLCQIDQACIDRAAKLQRALARALAMMQNPDVSSADCERAGLEDYASEFGRAITDRHLRNLIKRTTARDGGAGDFQRLELFLDERPARKAESAPLVTLATQTECRELEQIIQTWHNPLEPTADEKGALWFAACNLFAGLCAQGAAPAKLRQRIVRYLFARVRGMAVSEPVLNRTFRRRFAAWLSDPTAASQVDKRTAGESGPAQRKATPYDSEQVDLVRYYAATRTGGRRAQAVRELNEQGSVTDPRLKKSLDTRTSKSQLPKSFRRKLADVPALSVLNIGPRATRKMAAKLELTFAGMHSMDIITGDDKTLDIYVPVPDGEGWFEMLRPQLLLFVDVKSMFAIGRAILPRSQYTAIDTWAGLKTAMMKWGLPKFIQREGGLWRKSKLVNTLAAVGNPDGPLSDAAIEFGLGKKGVQFVGNDEHSAARLESMGVNFRETFSANAKIVERVLGIISDQFEKLPGYSGRNERIDCPELTRRNLGLVRSRKAYPEELGFLKWPELISAIDSILNKYNTTKQEGRRLAHPQSGEPMTPEEAFEFYRNEECPPVVFDSRCSVLLSHVRIPNVTVKAPDLKRQQFPCGYVRIRDFVYCDAEFGGRIGQKLTAYFDPTMPETCTFTDDSGEPFTVPRLDPVNGWIMDDQTKAALAQARAPIKALKADFRAMESKFGLRYRRNIVSPETEALSAEVRAGQARVTEQRTEETRRETKVRKLSRKLKMTLPASAARRPETAPALERLNELLNED